MLYAIIVTAVLALAGIGLVWFFRREHRHRGAIRASPPPVVFLPPREAEVAVPAAPVAPVAPVARAARASAPSPASSFAPPPSGPQLVELPVARTVVVGADGNGRPDVEEPIRELGGRGTRRRRQGGGRLAEDPASVTLSAAATGTLRMLPGRFEVVEGHPADREIRFVAEPGIADQRFTMGRGEGPTNQHVRLQGQTVSRLHAALTYQGGAWAIENLSATNPLRVNGRPVDAEEAVVPLMDGDLIELGEVVLRFRT